MKLSHGWTWRVLFLFFEKKKKEKAKVELRWEEGHILR